MKRARIKAVAGFAMAVLLAGGALATDSCDTAEGNDYPTEARADYVFGCMEANGGTREALRRCSCSVDVVASIVPYDKYVEAETVLSVSQGGGEKTAIFHTPAMNERVAELRRAQAEAEIRCF
jgi:hypothetical protein